MNKRKVIFNTIHLNAVDYTLADFERDAQKARSAGATHMMFSQLEKSRWIWERERSDPYPNWGMLSAAVFKIIVPAELKGHLPEDFRTVVILCDIEGLTYEEIAQFVDCPLGTVRSRLHRGRKLLQAKLYDYARERGYITSPLQSPA